MGGAASQLRLALGPFQNRRLFSQHFLERILPEWPEFAELDVRDLRRRLAATWERERVTVTVANEAQTEERFIKPCLSALGFAYTVQAGLRVGGGRRQPDYALFLDEVSRARADTLAGAARYADAVAVADAKRFDRPLDRRRAGEGQPEDPEAQIINYVSITRRPWGILTNGRLWRLYGAEADLVEGACYEVDLVALLEGTDDDAFRYFAAFFAASSFLPGVDGRSFLDRALDESRARAIQVGGSLERQVFAAVPMIADGLLGAEERSEPALAEAFDHALVLLYRVLFCLHAEDRGLLPIEDPNYRSYSLRAQRESLAADRDRGRRFSERSDDLYNDLRALFRIVDEGEPALGVNEYDGGLFAAGRHPYFEGRVVPDALLAPALDLLYRVGGESVDYRDLSVRHLGTIYERLLDFRLDDLGGRLGLVAAEGRRETGAYFTPARVVDAIVERTLDPLLAARSGAIATTDLRGSDALEAFLELRVLDPAMGSGHFLVAAAAYIAQFIATDPSYDGDLPLVEIQRLVAERCLYGVDLNPMAVELARLSLWLTTVRGDEPLTFLHNLREGNSLVGADVASLLAGEGTLFAARLARDATGLLDATVGITARPSRTGDDVDEKQRLAEAVDLLRAPLEALADDTIAGAFTNGVGRAVHWELEFPDVFLDERGGRLSDGGFHAVIGNPPYVRIQALGRQLAEYCRRHYRLAHGSFDTYIPFIERSLSLLAPAGRLG
ncbi:MAG: Eco57I restriction-modification methylase domain-containing protein, partial [Chloroflexia bacterium]